MAATLEDRLVAGQKARAETIRAAVGAERTTSDAERVMALVSRKARETAQWQADHQPPSLSLVDGYSEEKRDLAAEQALRDFVGLHLDESLPRDVELMAALAQLNIPVAYFKQEVLDWVVGYGYVDICARIPDIEDLFIDGQRAAYYKCGSRPGYQPLIPLNDVWLLEQFIRQLTRHAKPGMSELNGIPPTWRLPGRLVRVKGIHPIVAAGEYSFTIRFLRKHPFTIADLVQRRLWSAVAAEFCRDIYLAGASFLVVGATGAGKSTLTYALSEIIKDERMVIIANPREIVHSNPLHNVLDVRDVIVEGGRTFDVHDLVVASLTMAPDRLFLTEARGGEMLPLLNGLSTGHGGSLTTIHADSLRDAMRVRIPGMVRAHPEGVGLTNADIASKITSAFDMAIFVRKVATPGGGVVRQVMEISLIHPATEDQVGGLQVPLSPVFLRNREGEMSFVGASDYPEKLLNRTLSTNKPLPDMLSMAEQYGESATGRVRLDSQAVRALEAA